MTPGKIKFKTRRQDIATITWPIIRQDISPSILNREKPFIDLSFKPEGGKNSAAVAETARFWNFQASREIGLFTV
jgi:hypothetical protein